MTVPDNEENRESQASRGPKDLNVVFQFNGHDFDAFEILGIPAGSSLEKVDEAYKKAREELGQDEHELINMAYHAITKK